MARLCSWDLTGYAPEWWDVDADVLGWWDRDLVPAPFTPASFISLLQGGGRSWVRPESGREPDYSGYEYVPNEDAEVSWETGAGEYGSRVTFQNFEQKIVRVQTEEAKRADFGKMTAVMYQEEHELAMARLRRAAVITVSATGAVYVLWKLLPLL
jgi:hypothetical protein